MARQVGVFPIRGTIDELTFYWTPDDGHLVKRKTSVTGKRVKTDPDFARTMLNAAEFTTSFRSAQLLRKALDHILFPIVDGKLSGRMNQEMVRVVQLDPIKGLGERAPCCSTLTTLEGFEFNRKLTLKEALLANYSIEHDEANQSLSIHIPSFTPAAHITAPAYVEHFKLLSGLAVVNFEEKHYAHEFWGTEALVRDQEPIDPLRFTYPAKIPPGYTLFLTLGILFYAQLENIPKEDMSQRKRIRLKSQRWKDGITPFTGALALVKVIAGEEKVKEEKKDDAWEMDGLGLA
ncbi:MAG: hypothetical protein J7621_24490 [Niastella sp.]|nr:hypothetical protein [Niastella sp.]